VLVTTLTKRMAEDLTEFLNDRGVAAKYLHSDIDTLERVAVIQALRNAEFYVLVGINLLREGLDIPEVSLVAILDADKEGFLRSPRSLIQTFGRASRNVNGRVIMYADKQTRAMRQAMEETERRREKQVAHNERHGIEPQSIVKSGANVLYDYKQEIERGKMPVAAEEAAEYGGDPEAVRKEIKRLEKEMRTLAKELEFEKAARVRDRMLELKEMLLV
jgi:excinuclease ABC subunit B